MKATKRVGFQGERGAFSEMAALKMVKGKVELVPFPSFLALFRALAGGRIDFATIAIENTLAGSIHENYDLLLRYRLPILAETNLRIVHNLIAPPGVSFSAVHRVFSHPVALQQCRKFLDKHRRKLDAVTYYDTAGSVKMVVEKKLTDAAAIAGKSCAEIYGGRMLAKDIGDDPQNYTRFFLLGPRSQAGSVSGTKTSIVFATRNAAGALFRCISVFALRDINLTKIESRPLVGRPFEYRFYLDFIGNPASRVASNALKNLSEITEFVHVLGCYSSVP